MRDHTPILVAPNKLTEDSPAKDAVAEVGEGFLGVGLRGTAEVGVLGGVLNTRVLHKYARGHKREGCEKRKKDGEK